MSTASGPPERCAPTYAEALFRHASARSRSRSAHDSDPVRPSRSQRDHHLSASFAAPSSRDRESFGFTEVERVDEPATAGGGRSHPQRGSCFPRTKPPLAQLEACQSAAGHSAVSHRRTWRASRSVHPLRTSRHHLLQLLPQPALPEVPDFGAGTVDRCTSTRTSPFALRPCGLHTASSTGATGATEHQSHLWPVAPRQCGNTSRSRPRSATPRRGNRILQRAAHLESEARASPACPLRHSRRRPVARSHALGYITRSLLSFHPRAP